MTRILVVDDVKLFRHLEASILGWRGYTIEEAGSGEEAMQKVRANPPDLVLVDLLMPGMSGHEVCQQIKTHPDFQSIPVIIVTSSSSEKDIREAVKAGCDDYLTKPLDDTTLVRKVEELLGNVDRRRFPRIPTSLQISFEDFKGIFFEYTRDVSRSGVFIEMEDPLPVDSCLRLSFSLPEPFHSPVLAYGRVVRQVKQSPDHPGGVGVRFIQIDEANRRMIDALVAAQPQLEQEHRAGIFSRVSVQEQAAGRLGSPAGGGQLEAVLQEREVLRQTLEQLQADHLRLSTILSVLGGLHGEASPQRVVAAAGDILQNLLGAAAWGIFLADPARPTLVPVASAGLPGAVADALGTTGPLLAALQQRSLQVPAAPWPVPNSRSRILAVAPLVCGERALGVITVHELFPQKVNLNANDNQLLQLLGSHLARALLDSVARQLAPGEIGIPALLKAL
jgi:uncharacterized protein (TIGR02266 family)